MPCPTHIDYASECNSARGDSSRSSPFLRRGAPYTASYCRSLLEPIFLLPVHHGIAAECLDCVEHQRARLFPSSNFRENRVQGAHTNKLSFVARATHTQPLGQRPHQGEMRQGAVTPDTKSHPLHTFPQLGNASICCVHAHYGAANRFGFSSNVSLCFSLQK